MCNCENHEQIPLIKKDIENLVEKMEANEKRHEKDYTYIKNRIDAIATWQGLKDVHNGKVSVKLKEKETQIKTEKEERRLKDERIENDIRKILWTLVGLIITIITAVVVLELTGVLT